MSSEISSKKTLTRADIVNNVLTEFKVSKPQATSILENVLSEISKTLSRGTSVKITAFGTFTVRKKQERTGRNPRTGEHAVITPRQVISFRASPLVKSLLKNGKSGTKDSRASQSNMS